MASFTQILLLCTLVSLCMATNSHFSPSDEHVVQDDHAISFRVGLKQQNLKTLDSLFWQITDPHSPLFGKFLDDEQLIDLISLPEEDIQRVENFLEVDSGKHCKVFIRRSVHHDSIYVHTCVAQAKAIFPNLDLKVYKDNKTEGVILRASALTEASHNHHLLGVPVELHDVISGIHGITDLPIKPISVHPQVNPELPWQNSDKQLTVLEMIELFDITYDGIEESTWSVNTPQVKQGVIEFGALYSNSELAQFQEKYGMPNNPIQKVVGTIASEEEYSGEASLDVQTITTIAGKAETWAFNFTETTGFVDVVNTLLETEGAPLVLSCSYEAYESDFSVGDADEISNQFMKLGLKGFSFFISSGDAGPSLGPQCDKFDPQFPGTSPYLTTIGGTKINKYSNVQGAWMHSSGGFSTLMDRPAYQKDAVDHYLKTATMPSTKGAVTYTTTGRAYPDASAIGALEPLLVNGAYTQVGGTSGACPQFAGITTLINILRYQKGLGPIGPLAQTLWTLPGGVGFDVTEGQSFATNRSGTCEKNFAPGFRALKGWDPVTGNGSPKFSTLVQQLLNVPGESS